MSSTNNDYRRSDSQRSEPYNEVPMPGVGRSGNPTPAQYSAAAGLMTPASIPPTPQEEGDRRAVQALGSATVPPTSSGYVSAPTRASTSTTAQAAYGISGDVAESLTAAGKPLGEVVVELRGLSKQYRMHGSDTEIVSALKCINLCDGLPNSFPPIRRGEFVMIRGPSGGGKTTLLNMIGTIDSPTDGIIKILGNAVDSKSDDDALSDLRLRHIGFVFQTFNLIPTMSALENVELPMTLLGDLTEKERKSRAKQLLALVGLRNRIHHLPSELSGGEQQRTTIARALANNPTVLLLDEPTGDLDTATTIDVMDLLLNINTMAGTTMIMVTHNPDVECYADRILYVNDGQFAQQAINAAPCPLVLGEYEAYLKRTEAQNTTLALNAHNNRSAPAPVTTAPSTAPAPIAHPLTSAGVDNVPRTPIGFAPSTNREDRPTHHQEDDHPVGETNSLL